MHVKFYKMVILKIGAGPELRLRSGQGGRRLDGELEAALVFIVRHPSQHLRTKGVICSKSAKKIHFEGNLCYPGFHKTIWPRKRNLFDVKLGERGSPIF